MPAFTAFRGVAMIVRNVRIVRIVRTVRVVRVVLLALGVATTASAQVLPNPYRIVDGWAKLPDGRKMGAVGTVDLAPDGTHIRPREALICLTSFESFEAFGSFTGFGSF